MGITLNDFVNAIADKLKKIYPDYDIYADEVKQEQKLSNYLFISVINASQKGKLGKRSERIYDFDIFYFQEENKNINFFDWAEKMMNNFELLEVGEDIYHVRDIEFDKTDEVGHFTFSVKFYIIEIDEQEKMESLKTEGRVKNG